MNRFIRNLNAIIAIAAREVMNFVRSPGEVIFTFIFPIIFMGILGGSLVQNLSGGIEYDLMQFILFGVVVSTLYQTTMMSITSLIEDRENDFTQELFVAPISRFALILGKVLGGTVTSLFSLVGLFVIALIMQVPLTWADVGRTMLLWPIICIAGGALGILFISLVNDSRTADWGSMMLVFPQMFLAGVMIPISNSSGILGVLAHLMPMTYLVDLLRSVVYVGNPAYNEIVLFNPALDLALTAGIAAVFIVAGTLIFSHNERTR